MGCIVIDGDREAKQEQEPPVPPAIKHKTGHKQKPVLPFERQKVIAEEDQRQEDRKGETVKDHERQAAEQSCATHGGSSKASIARGPNQKLRPGPIVAE